MRTYCLIIVLICIGVAWGIGPSAVVNNILGLDPQQAGRLTVALSDVIGANTDLGEYSDAVTEYLARAVVNEIPENRAVQGVSALVGALRGGAPRDEALDIAEIGFFDAITAQQIISACTARSLGRQFGLDAAIVDEVIYDCISNRRRGDIIEGIIVGIEKGIRSGVRQDKCAIALMLRFANDNGNKSIREIVDEEIKYVNSHRDEHERKLEALIDSMYHEGMDGSVVREVMSISYEEQWSPSVRETVLRSLRRSRDKGMLPEMAATLCVVKIAQGFEGDLARILDDEIDHTLQRCMATPRNRSPSRNVAPGEKKTRATNYTSAAATGKTGKGQSFDVHQMEQSMQSFLTARAPQKPSSTPYKWGGTTRKGVDCSGFTSVCYREMGIVLPRVSREQFATFKKKHGEVRRNDLKYGDLIFFSSNGGKTAITHVGIYYHKNNKGEDLFVHSSCTPGVNIGNLTTNKYWNPRYAGAVRVVK